MLEKPYRIVGSMDHEMSVAKVKYGQEKYIIVKCKNSIKSLKGIENALNAFLRGGKNNSDGYYFHFFNHIQANPGSRITVSYLSQKGESDIYRLLQIEQLALDAGRNDPNMMNNQTESHIPIYNDETGLYGWISAGVVLNYRNWMRRRKRQKKDQ